MGAVQGPVSGFTWRFDMILTSNTGELKQQTQNMKNQLKLEIIPAGRSQRYTQGHHPQQWFIIALGIICPKHRQFLDVEINKSREGKIP